MPLGGVDTGFLDVPSPVFRLLTSAIIRRSGTSENDVFLFCLFTVPIFGGVEGLQDYYFCTMHTIEHCTALYNTIRE